jgi:YD repeat-containing protein
MIMLLLLASPVFSATISHVYDELDRLHIVTLENGQKITYEYDKIGNIISKTPSGNVATITANAMSGGAIYPNGSVTVTVGSNTTFTITPANGYILATLTDNGTNVISRVSGNTTITVAPANGYHLASLTDNGVNVTGSVTHLNTYTITNVTATHTIVATFAVGAPPAVPALGPWGILIGAAGLGALAQRRKRAHL